MGFALIWHIWWMAILGFVCALLTLLAFGWVARREDEISAEEVARIEGARQRRLVHA